MSAGQITPAEQTPYFVIIDRALRDEGTSYHYVAPSEYGHADPGLVATAVDAFKRKGDRALPCCIAPFSQRGYENYTLGDATQQTLREICNGPAC
jgi:hypothetical protein